VLQVGVDLMEESMRMIGGLQLVEHLIFSVCAQ